MKSVTTYLSFDGNCRQAMSFYQQCLGSELQLYAYPDAQGHPSSDPGRGSNIANCRTAVERSSVNMPWGARFGMLTDKFGIQWILNCNLPG